MKLNTPPGASIKHSQKSQDSASRASVKSDGRHSTATRYLRDAGNSKRTIDPDYPVPPASALPRKKLIPTPHFLSQVTFTGGTVDPETRPQRKDTKISLENSLAQPELKPTVSVTSKSKDLSEQPQAMRTRTMRHLVSSIPYLSNDGREPKYEAKDAGYRSIPIWMREEEARNSKKKLLGAKMDSLKSSFFTSDSLVSDSPYPQSKSHVPFLSECLTESPMFLSRKPKPSNIQDPFASFFELA